MPRVPFTARRGCDFTQFPPFYTLYGPPTSRVQGHLGIFLYSVYVCTHLSSFLFFVEIMMGALLSYPSVLAFTGFSCLNICVPHSIITAFKANCSPGRDQSLVEFVKSLVPCVNSDGQTLDLAGVRPDVMMMCVGVAGGGLLIAYGAVVGERAIYSTVPMLVLPYALGCMTYVVVCAKRCSCNGAVAPSLSDAV